MRNSLREAAKIGVGLVIADLVSAIWLSGAGFFPITMLGITWPESVILPVIVFDSALIILLSHYAWHTKMPIASPNEHKLLMFVGTVFLIVSLLHLVRIAFGWEFIIAGVGIPEWISWLGVMFAAYLSYSSFHFALRGR